MSVLGYFVAWPPAWRHENYTPNSRHFRTAGEIWLHATAPRPPGRWRYRVDGATFSLAATSATDRPFACNRALAEVAERGLKLGPVTLSARRLFDEYAFAAGGGEGVELELWILVLGRNPCIAD